MKIGVFCVITFLVICFTTMETTESAMCPSKLDLVFVIDSSGSIGRSNWEILTDFLVLVVDRFNIGPNAVRVAAVRFATSVDVLWTLDNIKTATKSSLKTALKNIDYTKGYTSTPYALFTVATKIFGQPGDRNDVPNLVVVVTDGKSNKFTSYLDSYAAQLKVSSRVISIGVTSRINYDELLTIATSNCEVYTVDDFTDMDDDMNSTMDLICGCMPGQYTDEQCKCKNCPTNQYQSKWAQRSCMNCPAGATTMGEGSSKCIDCCEPGYMVKSDGSGCEMCKEGTYQPNKNLAMCKPCDSGLTTLQGGSTSMDECIVLCPKGQRPKANMKQCELCPVGTYKPTTYSQDCMNCPMNMTTKSEGAKDMEDCLHICDAGQQYNQNTSSCQPCPKNYYKSERSEMPCTECPDGTITSDPGADDADFCYVGRGKQTSDASSSSNTGIIAGVVTVVLVLLIIGVLLFIFFCFVRRKKDADTETTTFKVPPKDDGHVYHEANDGNVYENPIVTSPMYDNLSSDKLPEKVPHNDVEYSNISEVERAKQAKADFNTTDLSNPNYSSYIPDNKNQNITNPVYENHDLLSRKS